MLPKQFARSLHRARCAQLLIQPGGCIIAAWAIALTFEQIMKVASPFSSTLFGGLLNRCALARLACAAVS